VVYAPELSGCPADVFRCPGVQLLQQGHNPEPQKVPAGGVRVSIGLVLNVGDLPGGGTVLQLRPGYVQQGTADPIPLPLHTGQTLESGAPDQVQQDRLGVVAGMVGGVDPKASLRLRRPA
jgi:hypothetical protein